MKSLLDFFLQADADIAEYFSNSLIEWVAEGVDADGIDTADALNLNQEALNAWYNCPDVDEREYSKVNAPDERYGNANKGRQQAVKPIFRHGEGGEAGFPDAIETVCPLWFCNHIFKINLDYVVIEMLGVAVDQINLLGVRIVHLLLVHFLCHYLVVGLVNIALFPDRNGVEMPLRRVVDREREVGTGGGEKNGERNKASDQRSVGKGGGPRSSRSN